jgi:putative lipoprotein
MPSKLQRRLLSCGTAALLGACAFGPPPRPAVEPPPHLLARVYDCDGEEALVELDGSRILLALPSRQVHLTRVSAASGVKYASDGTTFWMKGPSALLELPGRTGATCEENRPRSLREDARLRGVRYRGLGNEPGWRIEIGPEEILVETDYGENRVVLPLPQPVPSEGGHTYEQTSASHHLHVSIEEALCLDSMTGDEFGSKVRITLDGRDFQGCGDVLR